MMKYLFVLALLVPTILAEEEIQINDEEPKVEAANFYPINMISRMRYSAMGNAMAPPQQAIQHYSLMKDEDFPVDYNLACSNTCNCRTVCVMYWWVPCTCACPPPCSNNNNNNNQNNQNNNRFPPIEWQPETQPPRFPIFPRVTTTTPQPIWNGRPNWNNPIPPRWPTPEWVDPLNPNNHPTHPPQNQQPVTPSPQPIAPPIWIDRNPNPWNPNNPNGFPTHPPPTAAPQPPAWWPNQRPNNPIIPLPEPIPNPNPPNWWEQPPQQPNPNPPNWWEQQPQQPIQPNPPNWWEQQPQQPNPNNPNWWEQQPQQPNPNPPNWWQQPQPIEQPCDNSCSCVPCTVIWVCPPACSASCCAARGFGNAEAVDKVENKAEVQQSGEPQSNVETSFRNYPDYLKDIFVPGAI